VAGGIEEGKIMSNFLDARKYKGNFECDGQRVSYKGVFDGKGKGKRLLSIQFSTAAEEICQIDVVAMQIGETQVQHLTACGQGGLRFWETDDVCHQPVSIPVSDLAIQLYEKSQEAQEARLKSGPDTSRGMHTIPIDALASMYHAWRAEDDLGARMAGLFALIAGSPMPSRPSRPSPLPSAFLVIESTGGMGARIYGAVRFPARPVGARAFG
jgi:hypothetical protein